MVEIFEKLGFSVQSKSGRSGRILSMTNLDKYLGVSVHFTDDETFVLNPVEEGFEKSLDIAIELMVEAKSEYFN